MSRYGGVKGVSVSVRVNSNDGARSSDNGDTIISGRCKFASHATYDHRLPGGRGCSMEKSFERWSRSVQNVYSIDLWCSYHCSYITVSPAVLPLRAYSDPWSREPTR
jgi:hypothetical protein